MSSPRSPNVKLPSINELFPEHLLPPPASMSRRYSQSSSKASPISPYAAEPAASYPHTSTRIIVPARVGSVRAPSPVHAEYHDSSRRVSMNAHATPPPVALANDARTNGRCTESCCNPDARASRDVAAMAASHNNATSLQVAAPYSFDVLRPNPLTANLENVASSHGASKPLRIPGAGGYAYHHNASDGSAVDAITKWRHTFRVQLPLASPMLSPSESFAPHFVRADEHEAPHTFPPNFSANQYLSSPTTPGSAQSLQRLTQPQPETSAGSDEKRHCCPHCNKRFNRPSSLNIHVNTHTGAKPFECRYPGCHRRFNVNSNMRRHYRNHLNGRRRDAVARLLPPSPSPPRSSSRSRSPESAYQPPYPYTHPAYLAREYGRSASSFSDPEEYERPEYVYSARVSASQVKHETSEPLLGLPESSLRDDRCRLRSNSSPVPRYGSERDRVRAQNSACVIPGCPCVPPPISTALRPAFADYAPTLSREA
ncbi:uncharacterized protein LAESUDRAFT_754274 [Laetiporus sulphureus 93-53]|uniref:C2H2-type domain-containing protein n=1 Tax=Laetiporus sulphureus 93-53 TaxID=1314785 RepID=A0A165IMM2_9APHY|nr:uncharacterized protein LAESUDRAFT_754274 [Laetiporus sulphureus 93-53]KZT13289.1 hypothetical protein LAESUDRAFT_754274 [Laetiporus sulphureus 93-53]